MTPKDRERLLVKVAHFYYEHELTQSQISERLNLSRQKVQRLLKEARQTGIVQINIRPVLGIFTELEGELEQTFSLREAIVVETTDYSDHELVTREIGVAAGEYLQRITGPDDTLTISWGSTVLGMVNAISREAKNHEYQELRIVQSLGGLGNPVKEIHAADLTRRLAQKFGGKAVLLPAPGVAGTTAAAKAFREDPHVKSALDLGESAHIAVMGIGAPRPDSLLIREGTIVSWQELAELESRGAVGDINLRFFDRHGEIIASDLNERVIGVSLEALRKIDTVIGIAGGKAKFNAIFGALQGKLVNVLVTDNVTATKLLDRNGTERSEE